MICGMGDRVKGQRQAVKWLIAESREVRLNEINSDVHYRGYGLKEYGIGAKWNWQWCVVHELGVRIV